MPICSGATAVRVTTAVRYKSQRRYVISHNIGTLQVTTAVRHNADLRRRASDASHNVGILQVTKAVRHNADLRRRNGGASHNVGMLQATKVVRHNANLQQRAGDASHNVGMLQVTKAAWHNADLRRRDGDASHNGGTLQVKKAVHHNADLWWHDGTTAQVTMQQYKSWEKNSAYENTGCSAHTTPAHLIDGLGTGRETRLRSRWDRLTLQMVWGQGGRRPVYGPDETGSPYRWSGDREGGDPFTVQMRPAHLTDGLGIGREETRLRSRWDRLTLQMVWGQRGRRPVYGPDETGSPYRWSGTPRCQRRNTPSGSPRTCRHACRCRGNRRWRGGRGCRRPRLGSPSSADGRQHAVNRRSTGGKHVRSPGSQHRRSTHTVNGRWTGGKDTVKA